MLSSAFLSEGWLEAPVPVDVRMALKARGVPVLEPEGVDRMGLYPLEDTNRLPLRKSQMNFGWVFCGHCLTHGLWKGVSIRFREDTELEAPCLRTVSLEEGGAALDTVRFRFGVRTMELLRILCPGWAQLLPARRRQKAVPPRRELGAAAGCICGNPVGG